MKIFKITAISPTHQPSHTPSRALRREGATGGEERRRARENPAGQCLSASEKGVTHWRSVFPF